MTLFLINPFPTLKNDFFSQAQPKQLFQRKMPLVVNLSKMGNILIETESNSGSWRVVVLQSPSVTLNQTLVVRTFERCICSFNKLVECDVAVTKGCRGSC